MKTIGTCKECEYLSKCEIRAVVTKAMLPVEHWGCADWKDKNLPRDNYPTRTAQDLEIADLKRENNAAFERIKELSEALYNLGYDPTAKVISKSL